MEPPSGVTCRRHSHLSGSRAWYAAPRLSFGETGPTGSSRSWLSQRPSEVGKLLRRKSADSIMARRSEPLRERRRI
jgi:hypothetical protein